VAAALSVLHSIAAGRAAAMFENRRRHRRGSLA